MDIITTICLSLVSGIASHAGQVIAARAKDWLYELFKDKSDKSIYDALAAAGNLADSDIRKRVAELTAQKKLPAAEAEELATLLINLAHGIRAHTTHGSLRSTFVRCERVPGPSPAASRFRNPRPRRLHPGCWQVRTGPSSFFRPSPPSSTNSGKRWSPSAFSSVPRSHVSS